MREILLCRVFLNIGELAMIGCDPSRAANRSRHKLVT